MLFFVIKKTWTLIYSPETDNPPLRNDGWKIWGYVNNFKGGYITLPNVAGAFSFMKGFFNIY